MNADLGRELADASEELATLAADGLGSSKLAATIDRDASRASGLATVL